MEREKRKSLEAAGFRIGEAEEFLGLTEEECRLVELRVAASRAIRRLREQNHLTQHQLAARLKSSQSRVAKMEAGAADVSLDLLFRGLFAVGGGLADLDLPSRATKNTRWAGQATAPRKSSKPSRKRAVPKG